MGKLKILKFSLEKRERERERGCTCERWEIGIDSR